MNYNYVIFDGAGTTSEDNYYVICLKDLENREDVLLNHMPLQERHPIIRWLYFLHNSSKLNKLFQLPFKKCWFPFIFKNSFNNRKPICFICIRYPSIEYLRYLRYKYVGCKIVKISRDVLDWQMEEYQRYSDANVFDYWMSYDKGDCAKYNLIHFDEFESKIKIMYDEHYPKPDVLFVGAAKDRLPKLIHIYDYLEKNGINCLFYILGGNNEVKRKGLNFIKKPLSYKQMLQLTVNSRCILDINQRGADGYTSRFLEAVMFDKYLISDNQYIKSSPFYDPQYIKIINTIEEIDPSFINKGNSINYNYSNEFSPIHLLNKIDELLEK